MSVKLREKKRLLLMINKFAEFQAFLKNHEVVLLNNEFQIILDKFNFHYFEDNLNEEILTRLKNAKIIIIDEYNESDQQKYYFICFDYTFIIIKQNHNFKAKINLSKHGKCQKYFLKNDFLSPDGSEKGKRNLNNEISYFSKQFQIENTNFQSIWSLISRSICAFLIRKSYLNNQKKYSAQKILTKGDKINWSSENYFKIRELGRGSSSVVDLIYNIQREEIFALKIPYNNCIELIKRERENYLKIQNPFIVHYYGCIESNQMPNLLIEFIDGETLDKYDTSTLNYNEKYNMIFELMISLHFIQSNKCLYRDLKPNNVIINSEKDAILIDFDRVINIDEQFTKDFNSDCIPPELFFGERLTYKSDVYSLGYIIYYILFDKKPTKKKSTMDDFMMIDLSELSENSKEKIFLEKCFEMDQSKRPSMTELIRLFYIDFLSLNDSQGEKEMKLIEYFENNIKKIVDEKDEYYLLGLIYYEDIYVPQDIDKSIYYFQLAANKNDSRSQNQLGLIYSEELYVPRDMNKAIHYFTLAANQDNAEAQYNLGVIHYEGISVPQNIDKAIHYYLLAAKQENTDALFNLGLVYSEGLYITPDYEKSVHYFTLAANKNDPVAQYNLGVFYSEGRYVSRDISKAIHYYTLAADQGHSDAQYNLALLYSEGLYISRDADKAIHYFEQSAEQNNADAQYNLGQIYFEGKVVSQNINEAIKLFVLASEQNHPKALNNLGLLYLEGVHIPRNVNKAIHYLLLASEQNEPRAQYHLGLVYLEGLCGSQDLNKAIHYFTLASDQNISDAQYNLGLIYSDGKYISRDIEKAVYYFTLAAKQNHPSAQYNLGVIFYEGYYVTRDIAKSIHYLKLAAEQDFSDALYNLGSIYYYGKYVPRDIDKSINYFFFASNLLNAKAQFILGCIYYDGKDASKAIHYFQLAANSNVLAANHNLGIFYYTGKYIPSDINKAIYYFSYAAKQNFQYSQYILGLIYYEGLVVNRDIDKAIHYFSFAAKQNNALSQFFLGSIYYEGLFVSRDIEKAIHFFKEASCFDNCFSKNNLGIIYKTGDGVKSNIFGAIEYLKEAINKKSDPVAMFNLAHIYFYKEAGFDDYKETLKLLIKSLNRQISHSLLLLCLVVIKKHKSCIESQIKKEFEEIDKNSADLLACKVVEKIRKHRLIEEFFYEELFDILKDINLVYYGIKIENQTMKKKIEKIDKRININKIFYDGLGDVMFGE